MKVEVSRGLRRRRPANFLILLSTILFLSCPQRSLWLLPHTVSLTSFHVSLCSSFSHLFSLLSMCFPKSQTPFLNHLYWHLFSFFSAIQFNRSLSIQFYFFFCLCWFLFFQVGQIKSKQSWISKDPVYSLLLFCSGLSTLSSYFLPGVVNSTVTIFTSHTCASPVV